MDIIDFLLYQGWHLSIYQNSIGRFVVEASIGGEVLHVIEGFTLGEALEDLSQEFSDDIYWQDTFANIDHTLEPKI